MKRVAILQSNYIPWKGYFDMIASVDEFILFDDMQYTRRDWRNRNKIKTPNGLQWLSVPVQVKGKYHQKIVETKIDGNEWMSAHWGALLQNYRKAPCFAEISEWLEPLYQHKNHVYLSVLNRLLIEAVCGYLGIDTKLTNSWDYAIIDGKTERLADLCLQAGATHYVSGVSAKTYIDLNVFTERGLEVDWFDYSGYQEYPQLWGGFEHQVSILDLLFNCGLQANKYMRYLRS